MTNEIDYSKGTPYWEPIPRNLDGSPIRYILIVKDYDPALQKPKIKRIAKKIEDHWLDNRVPLSSPIIEEISGRSHDVTEELADALLDTAKPAVVKDESRDSEGNILVTLERIVAMGSYVVSGFKPEYLYGRNNLNKEKVREVLPELDSITSLQQKVIVKTAKGKRQFGWETPETWGLCDPGEHMIIYRGSGNCGIGTKRRFIRFVKERVPKPSGYYVSSLSYDDYDDD